MLKLSRTGGGPAKPVHPLLFFLRRLLPRFVPGSSSSAAPPPPAAQRLAGMELTLHGLGVCLDGGIRQRWEGQPAPEQPVLPRAHHKPNQESAVFAAGEGTEIDSLPSGAPLDDPTFLPAQRAAHQTAGSAIQSAPGRLKWPDLAAAPLRFRGPGKFFTQAGDDSSSIAAGEIHWLTTAV